MGHPHGFPRKDNPDMHHPSEARQSLACMPVYLFFLVNSLINKEFVHYLDCIIWTVLFFYSGLYYLFGPSVRGHNCNKCACVCCMSSYPTAFFPFSYPLLMVRLGHISISIQYDSMFASFICFACTGLGASY